MKVLRPRQKGWKSLKRLERLCFTVFILDPESSLEIIHGLFIQVGEEHWSMDYLEI